MLEKAMETIQKVQMLEQGDRIAVGVSGGADSVALLDFLWGLRERYDCTLLVCHVNHGLRGAESLRDQEFVRELAARYRLEFCLLTADAAAEAAARGQSVEEAGRELRYGFFRQCAGANGKIATAHTLSDSMETLLLNLTRGCGVKGLRGIPPVRQNIIRPLIACTRQEILEYDRERGLCYITDSTNASDAYSRNRLRLQVIPQLERLNPGLSGTMAGLMERMEEQWQMTLTLAEQAEEELRRGNTLGRAGFLALPKPVGDLLLQRLVEEAQGVQSARLLALMRQAALRGSGGVQVGEGLFFRAGPELLTLEKAQAPVPGFCIPLELSQTAIPVSVPFLPGKTLKVEPISLKEGIFAEKINKTVLKNAVDCDRIKSTVVLRQKQAGDRLAPWYRPGGTHLLKKLYQEAHIPPAQRESMAVLGDQDGLLWAQGFGADRRVAVTDQTQNAILLQVVEDKQHDEQL